MGPLIKTLVALIVSFGAGLAAIYFADPNAMQWYEGLVKPPLTPPLWSLMPLFIALYALMSISLAVVWSSDPAISPHEGWVRFYVVQLFFNASWILFFFGLHAILISFVAMLFLTFIIGALIIDAWEIDKRASYLLAPCFAVALYLAFIDLNIWFLN